MYMYIHVLIMMLIATCTCTFNAHNIIEMIIIGPHMGIFDNVSTFDVFCFECHS